MMRLANAFDPSSAAAALPGPNTGMPLGAHGVRDARRRAGPPGPMTTSSMPLSTAYRATTAPFDGSSATVSTTAASPALPGAAMISCPASSRSSAVTMACSRAPDPSTRILTGQATGGWRTFASMTDDDGLWHLLIHTPGPNADPEVPFFQADWFPGHRGFHAELQKAGYFVAAGPLPRARRRRADAGARCVDRRDHPARHARPTPRWSADS